MNEIKEMFKDIKDELVEIRKENKSFALSINTLTLKLNDNIVDVDKLKIEVDGIKKDKLSLLSKVIECQTKIENLEKDLAENEEFKKTFKGNLWKAFWWILGLFSAAFTAVATYFSK